MMMSLGQNDEMQNARELVAFRVGTQDYCVDIMSVREIRGWTPATSVPHAPEFVRGVINLRGTVLPIIDLSLRLGYPAPEISDRHVIIVMQCGEQVVGVLVDAVSDIVTILDNKIQPTPDVASDVAKEFIQGVIAIEDRMIRLISVDRLMPVQIAEAA